MEAIRSELAQLKELEVELSSSKWHDDPTTSTSPRGLVEDDDDSAVDSAGSTTTSSLSLIQRYEQARDLYLQRRLETLLVDHIATLKEEDGQLSFSFPNVRATEEEEALRERYQHALGTLEGSTEKIHRQAEQLRAARDAVASRRQELEQMVQDMLDDDADDDSTTSSIIDETELASEQERIERLQEQKRKLQDELAQIQLEAKEAQERTRSKQQVLQVLQQQRVLQEGEDDPEKLQKKVDELREIKLFYDSLRGVLEELGGVKIVEVNEDPVQHHLFLTLAFYDDYQVLLELEVYRKVLLKLVDAKWISQPEVRQKGSSSYNTDDPSTNNEDFFLTMDPLDDLVQVAKTTLGPPHDLRFLVRETLARIRIFQDRVEDLAVLRRQVLTKVHNGNQVVCSLNEGIVIVMRLYDRYIRLDQIVGIGGWDGEVTQKMQTAVLETLDKEYKQDDADIMLHGSKVTPMIIVQCVQDELERLQNAQGRNNPVTPRFPERKKGGF